MTGRNEYLQLIPAPMPRFQLRVYKLAFNQTNRYQKSSHETAKID